MSLKGKIIDLGKGRYGFESVSADHNRPILIRHVWPIGTIRTHGMSYCRIEESIGRDATLTYGRFSCYLGNGNYVSGELPELGSTQALVVEETAAPAPKVRKNTFTRWQFGRWEKQTAKGWKAA